MLQVVNDITNFYMQTYKNYQTTGDERLKDTLRLIQKGVSLISLFLPPFKSKLLRFYVELIFFFVLFLTKEMHYQGRLF